MNQVALADQVNQVERVKTFRPYDQVESVRRVKTAPLVEQVKLVNGVDQPLGVDLYRLFV